MNHENLELQKTEDRKNEPSCCGWKRTVRLCFWSVVTLALSGITVWLAVAGKELSVICLFGLFTALGAYKLFFAPALLKKRQDKLMAKQMEKVEAEETVAEAEAEVEAEAEAEEPETKADEALIEETQADEEA